MSDDTCIKTSQLYYLLPAHTQLDLVNTEIDVVPNNFSHLIRAISISSNASDKITIPSGHLFSICEIAWARDVSCVDSVSDNDIKPLFRRSCTKAPVISQYVAFIIA